MRFSISIVAIAALLGICLAYPEGLRDGHAAEVAPPPRPKTHPLLATSAIKAVLDANGGVPPATGEQLWRTLAKLDEFAQMPMTFSGVRLDSGLSNPRVLLSPLAPTGGKLGHAGANKPNLVGRLYLAANMDKNLVGGDPAVTSVEFISWNSATRRFDFGVIENMGPERVPEFQFVDSGKCSSCHKNRGPILCESPWTNSVHMEITRKLVANRLSISTIGLPAAAPAAGAIVGAKLRERIDGMALASSDAVPTDQSVAIGRQLRVYREMFQLMNRSTAGRRAFVALLTAIAAPGEFNPNNADLKVQVNAWADDTNSFSKFLADCQKLLNSTNSGVLRDFAPFSSMLAKPSAARRGYGNTGLTADTIQPVPSPPPTGFRTTAEAQQFNNKVKEIATSNERILQQIENNAAIIAKYDENRAQGRHGMPSTALASNPRAFVNNPQLVVRKPTDVVNATLLALTIGLTQGDRQFLAHALEEAGKSARFPKSQLKTLAKAVFESPAFADVLTGGELPDRDEFKDRFVEGLDHLLKTKYNLPPGFAPDRGGYAYGPRYDPKTVPEEIVAVPTTACLRCHDVRPSGKPRAFEPIPALPFDPFDKQSRESWLKTAAKERRREVLNRLQVRLFKDDDMPPKDSPEETLFREKKADEFEQLKEFLEAEIAKLK